jgi:hypothetical protein
MSPAKRTAAPRAGARKGSKPAAKAPAKTTAKARAVSKPAGKSRPAPAAAIPDSPDPERIPWWRALLVLALALPLGYGALKTVAVKRAQHVDLQPSGPLVPQGENPGQLSGITAIKADGQEGIFCLTRTGPLWRVQHFDRNLALLAHVDLQSKALGELSDLAPMPDGGLLLAGLDGRLWPLDAALKPAKKPIVTGRSDLRTLDRLADGTLFSVDVSSASLLFFDPAGKLLNEIPVKSASGARGIAKVPDGVAWLEFSDAGAVSVRVLDLQGKTLRRFKVKGIPAAAPVRLASSGRILVINDSSGTTGTVFYTLDGVPLGNNLGVGQNSIVNPGFVAGDPAGGVAYIHYGAGLIKVQLPWREKP